jgi:hypothetical protein
MLNSSKLWGIEKLVLLSLHFTLAGSLFAWRTDVDLKSDKLQGATRKGRVASKEQQGSCTKLFNISR